MVTPMSKPRLDTALTLTAIAVPVALLPLSQRVVMRLMCSGVPPWLAVLIVASALTYPLAALTYARARDWGTRG